MKRKPFLQPDIGSTRTSETPSCRQANAFPVALLKASGPTRIGHTASCWGSTGNRYQDPLTSEMLSVLHSIRAVWTGKVNDRLQVIHTASRLHKRCLCALELRDRVFNNNVYTEHRRFNDIHSGGWTQPDLLHSRVTADDRSSLGPRCHPGPTVTDRPGVFVQRCGGVRLLFQNIRVETYATPSKECTEGNYGIQRISL
ncbi:hypothetical protein EYF80_018222 [Liparis tanakae]|uniref:Uncharacterized protein n=1 Tax=Liparis tanakae TaxID=230148 RepID=A0A4Z2I0G7_9TELE|nr:hypothetical protein EYF80_018222 [Liparis tanakae]